MQAFMRVLAVLLALATPAAAQELSALARVDAARSGVEDGWFGKTTLRVG